MGKWKYEKGRCAARVQSFRGFKGFKGLWYRPLGDEFICRLSAAALPIGSESQTTSLRSWKCTPSAYGTSPRESVSRNFQSPYGSLQISFACHPGGGGLLSASLSANLSRSLHSGARSSPFGGKVVRQHQKGCISLAPKARLACFPTGESPVVWFYHTGALHFQRAPTTLDPDLRSLLYCLTSLPSHDSKPYPPVYQRIEYEEEGQGGGDEGGFR